LCEGGELFVAKGGERCGWGRILEGVGQIECGVHGVVGGRDAWDGDGVREESNGVGDANGVRFGDEYFPTAIVTHGGADDVALGAVCGPSATVSGFVVGDNFHSWRSERCAIVVENSVELGVCGELGVDAALLEEVEGDFGLWEEMAPSVEGERRVDGRKAGDEVIFEGLYLSFRGVAAMDGWGCELEGDGVIGDVILEGGGGLVIEFLEFRF
jgi:hypothetical protein